MTTNIVRLSAVVLPLAVPVATWGLVGQQNETDVPPSELDYVITPPDLPAGLETGLGIVALLLAGGAAAVLIGACVRRVLDPRWWEVLGPLVVAGLIAGYGWRVVTAGGADANIGAGLFILFIAPLAILLVLGAAGRGLWLARRRDRRTGTPAPSAP